MTQDQSQLDNILGLRIPCPQKLVNIAVRIEIEDKGRHPFRTGHETMKAGNILMLESLPGTATTFEKQNFGLLRYSQNKYGVSHTCSTFAFDFGSLRPRLRRTFITTWLRKQIVQGH